MNIETKYKIGLMAASMVMMSFMVPTSVLAKIAHFFPEASTSAVQMIITMPNLIAVVVAPIASKVVSYVYKKNIIIICTIFFLIGGIFPYFIHPNVYLILFGTALMGIGSGGLMTVIPALICDCFEGEKRGALLGSMAAFISIGGMFFSLLGGRLGNIKWENAFMAYYMILIILVIEIVCLPKGKKIAIEERKIKNKIPKEVIFLSLVGFIFYTAMQVYNSNISMLIDYRKLGGAEEGSYATTAYTFAGIFAGFGVGKLITLFNRKVITIAFFLETMGLLVTFLGKDLKMLCLGGILCGTGFFLFTPSGSYYVSEVSSPSELAFNLSIFSSLPNLGMAISPIVVNGIAGIMKTGVEMNFIYAAIMSFILIIINLIKYAPIHK